MNKFIAMGRLTADPKIYITPQNTVVANFSLAIERKMVRNDGVTVDFFPCVAFGKVGEVCEKYLKKGSKILATGRVENNSYINDENTRVYKTEFYVEEIEFAEKKSDSNNANNADNSSNTASRGKQNNSGKAKGNTAGQQMNIPQGVDDELPFK